MIKGDGGAAVGNDDLAVAMGDPAQGVSDDGVSAVVIDIGGDSGLQKITSYDLGIIAVFVDFDAVF